MTDNVIIEFKDGFLTYLWTDLEDVILDWYMENGVIDTLEMMFNKTVDETFNPMMDKPDKKVVIRIPRGIEREVFLPFFEGNFDGYTVDEFVTYIMNRIKEEDETVYIEED